MREKLTCWVIGIQNYPEQSDPHHTARCSTGEIRCQCSGSSGVIRCPYKRPNAIKAQMPNFFREDIFTFHSTTIGRPEQMKSVTTEKTVFHVSIILWTVDVITDDRTSLDIAPDQIEV